jgi:hypothetical protein
MMTSGQVIMWVLLFGGMALAVYGKLQQVKLSYYVIAKGMGPYSNWRKRFKDGVDKDRHAA